MRPAFKSDGETYYEYILSYVDDILAIVRHPKTVMEHIQANFKFMDNKVEPPEMYLGAKLKIRKLGNYET